MKKLKLILSFVLVCFGVSFATTPITGVQQVSRTLNLKIDWGNTDVNLSSPSTSLNKYILKYKKTGGSVVTIDNISNTLRTYTINGLDLGTYEVELIEVIRVEVPPTPFSLPYIDTEFSSGISTGEVLTLNRAPVAVCSDLTMEASSNCNVILLAQHAGARSTDPDNDVLTYQSYPEGPYAVGRHGITITVKDPDGLTSSCYFTLNVLDKTAPNVLAKNALVVLNNDGYGSLNLDQVDDRSFDLCTPWVTKTLSITNFNCKDVGFHSVRLTVSDNSGNVAFKDVTVEVRDNVGPAINIQALDVALDQNGDANIYNTIFAKVWDPCGVRSVSLSKDKFTKADIGKNLVVVSAFDNNGREAKKEVWVTVSNPFATIGVLSETPNGNGIFGVVENLPNVPTVGSGNDQIGSLNPSEKIVKKELGFSYGPNPATGVLNLFFDENAGDISVNILKKDGTTAKQQSYKKVEKSLEIDLKDLDFGIYYLKIESSDKEKTVRLKVK